MTRHEHQEAQRPAREPSRGVVGSYFGVLIVLLLSLIGLSSRLEAPLPLPEAATMGGAPSVRSPSEGADLPAYPPPAGVEPPGEPPPSF